MTFASLLFVLGFLPLALGLYTLAPGLRAKNLTLTLCSFVFYGWWRIDFILLMVFSTIVDHQCSVRMGPKDSGRPRRVWLLVSLVTNLGMLAWFKYANFGAEIAQDLGVGPNHWTEIVLPVGISFFTFQSMSYTIDVYRGEVRPVRSILDLLCFVSMFPQLVAGPIVRYREVQSQLVERRQDLPKFAAGFYLFAIGMLKKVLIADHVAWIADPVFASEAPGFAEAWLGALAYTLQIFFDFSGYSDMAVGLGLMLGFQFPKNFNSPYVARSITDFWHRWHMSLSTWLRDYLYIPLGGNRRSRFRTYFNLSATMLLGGLWHGAAWTFVIWGAFHGLFLAVERANGKRALWFFLPRVLQIATCFVVTILGWVVFRSESLEELGRMLSGMAFSNGLGEVHDPSEQPQLAWAAFAIGLPLCFFGKHSWELAKNPNPITVGWVLLGFAVSLVLLAGRAYTPFLYFQF
ncbi:MAG: MBOAT family protein [Planctomycetota bacterium]